MPPVRPTSIPRTYGDNHDTPPDMLVEDPLNLESEPSTPLPADFPPSTSVLQDASPTYNENNDKPPDIGLLSTTTLDSNRKRRAFSVEFKLEVLKAARNSSIMQIYMYHHNNHF